ncbi:ribonuclease H-like domain-containing protein [Tanacetum coccineum]
MTPSSPPSYQFLEPMPSSSLLHHTLLDPTTHTHGPTVDPQPNTHTSPITDPTQSPPQISPNSPGLTFPTNQPTSHEPHKTQIQTQNNPLALPIFDLPNLQTNTDPINELPRTYPMITWLQSGIVKPIDRLFVNTFLISPIHRNPSEALKDSQWRNALYDEYNVLVKNGTRLLVPRPTGARVVANGSSQQLGIDFDETFSLVVKPATIYTVLSLVVSCKWLIHQLDVKNAFLNGDLSETVYMHQPSSFVEVRFPNHVFRLQRSFYGLKQAPRAWFQHFGSQVAYLLLYVDDIILTASSTTLLQHLIDSLHREFDMIDRESKLGPDGVPVQDPTLYRSLAGGLQYLMFTRPDLSYAGTLDLDLHLYASSTTSLVGYIDADWAGCPSTRSAEAEYRVVANVVAEIAWLCNLLRELHSPLSTATLVYYDNVSVVYMSANPVQHQRMKHIEIDIHFVRDMVTTGQVRVLHVPSHFQYANIFTKGLPSALFEEFRSSLSVRPPPAPIARAY